MGAARRPVLAFVATGLAAAAVLVVLLAPRASSQPDGFEKVGADKGLDTEARDHALADGPLADYGVEGVGNASLGTGIAGLVGIIVTFAVGSGVVYLARRRRDPSAPPAAGSS